MMRISKLWVWGRWPKSFEGENVVRETRKILCFIVDLNLHSWSKKPLRFQAWWWEDQWKMAFAHSLWVAGCIFEVIFQVFSLHNNLESLSKSCRLSKAWEIASLLFNLPSDWGIFPTGAKRGFSWLYPFSDKQQLGSFDPIIATNLQVALSRPEISYDFLLTVCREFRKGNMMSLWPPRLVWEPQLNAELISFFEQ